MSRIQVGFTRVGSGSAARLSEEASSAAEAPRVTRIQAGSAARIAEDAKRVEGAVPVGTASFSLRAQNGHIQRRGPQEVTPAAIPLEGKHALPSGEMTQGEMMETPGGSAKANVSPHGVLPTQSLLQAEPLQGGAGRLKSFIRGFFLPEEPSQP